MGQIKLLSSIIMSVLFAIAILVFFINFGIDNNSDVLLSDDPTFTGMESSLRANITTFKTDVEDSSGALFNSSVTGEASVTETGEQFKVTVGTALGMSTTMFSSAYKRIFGQDTGFGVFLTAFFSLLVFIAAAYVYKAWVGKNPD